MDDPLIIDLGLDQRKKLLLVDDERNIAAMIEDLLSDDYQIVMAYTGQAAVTKAQWEKPDIVLTDLMMPDMGGYELVRALQGDDRTKDIPVIAMTARFLDDSTVKMIGNEYNVKGFLRKPFTGADLKAKIESVLGNSSPDTHASPF